MTDKEIVRSTGREIITDSNGVPIPGQNTKTFKIPQYATAPKCEEWVDEGTDKIMVHIMRIKADGHHREQFIPLEKFKELLKE